MFLFRFVAFILVSLSEARKRQALLFLHFPVYSGVLEEGEEKIQLFSSRKRIVRGHSVVYCLLGRSLTN
uniref:Putative secreted protein n=1 Tax=Anopheles marajoara TaxID=58244 RepID=A0A2M4CF88_9DIPT